MSDAGDSEDVALGAFARGGGDTAERALESRVLLMQILSTPLMIGEVGSWLVADAMAHGAFAKGGDDTAERALEGRVLQMRIQSSPLMNGEVKSFLDEEAEQSASGVHTSGGNPTSGQTRSDLPGFTATPPTVLGPRLGRLKHPVRSGSLALVSPPRTGENNTIGGNLRQQHYWGNLKPCRRV